MVKKKKGNPELAYGIPKAIVVGHRELTEEERKLGNEAMEEMLLGLGVLKPGQKLEDIEEKIE